MTTTDAAKESMLAFGLVEDGPFFRNPRKRTGLWWMPVEGGFTCFAPVFVGGDLVLRQEPYRIHAHGVVLGSWGLNTRYSGRLLTDLPASQADIDWTFPAREVEWRYRAALSWDDQLAVQAERAAYAEATDAEALLNAAGEVARAAGGA